jgi:hypothetical protein
MADREPYGAELTVNWAAELLKEKGFEVGGLENWGGKATRVVNGVPMTNPEVVNIARQYLEWPSRERLRLRYLNRHQSEFATRRP